MKNKLDLLESWVRGKTNVLLMSPGGYGKSYMIRQLAARIGDKCYCTATTGIAALNLAGPGIMTRTLHSWSGIGLGGDSREQLAAKVMTNKNAKKRWRGTSILIVDEVSMLGRSLFEKLDYVGRIVRECPGLPFGGLTLVLSGDFLQLPPVKDSWVFESPVWTELNFRVLTFNKPIRFGDSDPSWGQLLLRVRRGTVTELDMATLQTRVELYDEFIALTIASPVGDAMVQPTILYSLKRDVYAHNMTELKKLPGEIKTYSAKDHFAARERGVPTEYYKLLFDEAIPAAIELGVGAQVMLRANLDVDAGFVNGSRGVITRMEVDAVYVLFYKRSAPVRIAMHNWTIEDERMVATRSQIPLILAWSSTIHKLQGSTLDFAICDLGSSIFEDGQAYVALSRVRNFEGLMLKNLHRSSIRASGVALSYVNSIQTSIFKIGIWSKSICFATLSAIEILDPSYVVLFVYSSDIAGVVLEEYKLDHISGVCALIDSEYTMGTDPVLDNLINLGASIVVDPTYSKLLNCQKLIIDDKCDPTFYSSYSGYLLSL